MKRIEIYVCVILLCAFGISLTANGQNKKQMTIASYNIWDGFRKDSVRYGKFVEWAKNKDADILVLTELVGFKANDLSRLGEACGYQYTAIQKETGYPVGVLSKTPIVVVSKKVNGFWHGMMHVRTAGIDAIATHLCPFDWKFRRKEAQMIIDYIDSLKLRDYFVAGDFNAISPLDADEVVTHTTWFERIKRGDASRPAYSNLCDGKFDLSVISAFLAAGMDDPIGRMVRPAVKRMTHPSAFCYGWKTDDKRLPLIRTRLDYILVSPSLMQRCISGEVDHVEGVSDHYPVSIMLNK
jgi:endonuclease/exonuclease/phosphatase family metal-dependent hydrolase